MMNGTSCGAEESDALHLNWITGAALKILRWFLSNAFGGV